MHELNKTSLGDLEVLTITSGKYKQNSYIVTSQGTNDAIIVDAGLEFELLSKTLADYNLNPYVLLLTHGHFDHITCAEIVVKYYGIDCLIHNSDIKLVKQAGFYAYRFLKKKLLPPRNLTYFDNFPSLNWPGGSIHAIHTPGHTAGSTTFLLGESILFTGDTLFNSFVGPYSYPESNYQNLLTSVQHVINSHLDTVQIFPGHGDSWSIKDAKTWWELNSKHPPTFQLFQ